MYPTPKTIQLSKPAAVIILLVVLLIIVACYWKYWTAPNRPTPEEIKEHEVMKQGMMKLWQEKPWLKAQEMQKALDDGQRAGVKTKVSPGEKSKKR